MSSIPTWACETLSKNKRVGDLDLAKWERRKILIAEERFLRK
jgi:hypothetical protein